MSNFQPALQWDGLITGAHIATCSSNNDYGIILDGAIGFSEGRIAWIGEKCALPTGVSAKQEWDFAGHWITPGLIDCHTHLVYAGNRASEFAARLEGSIYEEISAQGGGIMSSVHATRDASAAELLEQSLSRLDDLMAEGITTIEIKSGYGLDLANERKMLQVATQLGKHRAIHITRTFLGAHAVPPEYNHDKDTYLAEVIENMLPKLAAAGLIDAVDGFCEKIAFTPSQIRKLFQKARSLNLPVKLHAEQLSNQGGAILAAEFNALSVDHLEYLDAPGIAAIARSNTVAVLLPAAFYYLRETQPPPIKQFRAAGIPMAIATDCNPGTAPITSLLTTLNFACILFQITPCEAILGATRHAAKALGFTDRGEIAIGKRADLAIWAINHPQELCYSIGRNLCKQRFFSGCCPTPR